MVPSSRATMPGMVPKVLLWVAVVGAPSPKPPPATNGATARTLGATQ